MMVVAVRRFYGKTDGCDRYDGCDGICGWDKLLYEFGIFRYVSEKAIAVVSVVDFATVVVYAVGYYEVIYF